MNQTITSTTVNRPVTPVRQAAVNGLAIVGFVALILIGIGIAIYAARFVPTLVGTGSTANVYFSSLFGGSKGTIQVVPTSNTPAPTGNSVVATTSTPVSTPAATTTPAKKPTYTQPAYTPGSTKAYVVTGTAGSGTAPAVNPYGLADLALTETVGYMTSSTDDSFVPSLTVPSGMRLAARITVVNQGTNITGPWQLAAVIPTRLRSAFDFTSDSQDSLNPGESRTFVIHTDPGEGASGSFQITLDPNNRIIESNENNNIASIDVTVN